jgi:hypothetical protein
MKLIKTPMGHWVKPGNVIAVGNSATNAFIELSNGSTLWTNTASEERSADLRDLTAEAVNAALEAIDD